LSELELKGIYLIDRIFFPFFAAPLRMRAGRTMMGGAAAGGIGIFCRSVGQAGAKQRGNFPSPWFCPICRANALCGKEV